MNSFLADMWNQCNYRTCGYGPRPWIGLDGVLNIHDQVAYCPQGSMVPVGTTHSTGVPPCEVGSNFYCAGRYDVDIQEAVVLSCYAHNIVV